MTSKKTSKKKYARKSNSTRVDVYERVTTAITDALDAGVAPWSKPWTSRPGAEPVRQQNAITGRPYRGINVFLLNVTAATQGYEDPRWLTFNQASARAQAVWLKANGHKDDENGIEAYKAAIKDGFRAGVRKYEKSTTITLWLPFTKDVEDEQNPGTPKKVKLLLLKDYSVFNVEQCDGLDLKNILPEPDADEPEFDSIGAADTVIEQMPQRPSMFRGGNRAYYSPLLDKVGLPEATDFDSPEAYYATAFHELAHATGHESRLGRLKHFVGEFGSDPYAQEELVAEMASAFLCGMVGIDSGLDRSAAYIDHWSDRIKAETKKDKRWLVMAASRAQKAADFILAQQAEDPTPTNGEAN